MRTARIAALVVGLAACGGGKASTPATPAVAPAGTLSGVAAERLVLLPTYRLNIMNELGWGDVPSPRGALRTFDSLFAKALDDRSIGRGWVMPPQLARDYARNPTYATDPYALAEEPLRAPKFNSESKVPDPLASQLRTIVAIGDARYVLAPVEIKLQRSAIDSTKAEPWLRLVLIDARSTEIRWNGEVKGAPMSSFDAAALAPLAARAAELFTTP